MALGHAVSIEIPPELYERLRQEAEHNQRSVEDILLNELHFLNVLSGSAAPDSEMMETFSDEKLWAIAHQQLGLTEHNRLEELLEANKHATLSETEETELDSLQAKVGRQMLARSQALLILQNRGHNVKTYLALGE